MTKRSNSYGLFLRGEEAVDQICDDKGGMSFEGLRNI
jgi:hypothetical protein